MADSELIIAIIAALASIAAAALSAWWGRRNGAKLAALDDDLQRRLKLDERRVEAQTVLDRYRSPLLASAVELKRRVGNIRDNAFLSYLHQDGHRADIAAKSTAYRLASYLGWREILTAELTYLRYQDHERTRHVLTLLEDVGSRLASSALDNVDGRARLMLWKDEQRAIGGLMRHPAGALGVIGFETFAGCYDVDFAPWLDAFLDDLRLPETEDSQRLNEVAASLDRLIVALDDEDIYADRF